MNEESQVQDVNEQTPEQEVKEAPINEVPYSRFKEVIDDKNTMKAELDALKHQVLKDAEDRKLKEMEAKGEYESALNMVRDDLGKKDSQIAEMKSQLEVYQSQELTKREMLLDKLSDEDKAIYGSLDNNALEAHIQRLNKQSIPSVGNSQPAETQGYKSLVDAARDFQKGKIDEPIYNRIRSAFRANQA
jgi:hypothetical protein